MSGTARYAIFLSGGRTSELTNLNITGSYYISVNLYGTHGATFTDCNITNDNTESYLVKNNAVWSNVAYTNPVKLVNSDIGTITINGYTESNTCAPKIYVDGTSKANIISVDDDITTCSKLLCVSPESTGEFTVKKLTINEDKSITISEPIKPVAKAPVVVNIISNKESVGTFETNILFDTLAGAVAAVKDGGTVTMLDDATESLRIAPTMNFTLDLNGKTITNKDGKHTIENYGKLVIVDNSAEKTGKVDNTSHAKTAFINYEGAVATLNGGTFDRSHENGIENSNTYYTIKNVGNLTINDGVSVTNNNGGYSSLVTNGYYTYTDNKGALCLDYHKDYSGKSVTETDPKLMLTINGGTFTGGKYCLKNDECGKMSINGGVFNGISNAGAALLNWNEVNITGGTFNTVENGSVLYNSYNNDTTAKGILKISNGEFNGLISGYNLKTEITGGKFTSDVNKFTAGGYFYDTEDKTVKPSVATVVDNASAAGVEVTLDKLEKNSAIDKKSNATYKVVLDTVKPEDKTAVDEIKSTAEGKSVIAYDIYVEKTENGVSKEIKDVTNQKVTIKLPKKAVSSASVKVYHVDNGANEEIKPVTVSNDLTSVSFTAPSFSAYAVEYNAAALSAAEITQNIDVAFENIGNNEYNIVLKAADAGKKINGLTTAELTFKLNQGTSGLVNYEITPAANMSVINDGNGNTYTFTFDGANASSATGESIVIGTVKFDGYCQNAAFAVDSDGSNCVTTTSDKNSLVKYSTTGVGGTLNVLNALIPLTITPEQAKLTVNVSFPNAISDNDFNYQNMKVTVSGNGINKTVNLGKNSSELIPATETKPCYYTVEFPELFKNSNYRVTVEGAGYRTASYTVSMTGDKTLNFWNNVNDDDTVIEKDAATGGVKTNFLAGDIVKDGVINIYDLSAVVSYFGTDNLVSDHPEYAKYDLNRDGVINSFDIAYVLVSWGK